MVPILVILTILAFLATDLVVQALARRREAARRTAAPPAGANHHLDWRVLCPAGYFLSPGHTWAHVEPDGTVVAGVDDFARQMLGRPDAVELPRVGSALRAGESMATLYKDERLAHLAAPLDGVVTEVHADLATHPQPVARDPYGEGWLLKFHPSDLGLGLGRLRVAEEARRFLAGEVERARGFLQTYPAARVAADGGEPVDGVIAVLGQAAWEEFRRGFLMERF